MLNNTRLFNESKIKIILSGIILIFICIHCRSIHAASIPYIEKQKDWAVRRLHTEMDEEYYGNTDLENSSYSLYSNALTIGICDTKPGQMYKLYRRQAGTKKWKKVQTFKMGSDEIYRCMIVQRNYKDWFYEKISQDDFYMVECRNTKLKPSTKYYYRVYSCKDKKFSKSVAYWTAPQHPEEKQVGNYLRWNKVKGVTGYIIDYQKQYATNYDSCQKIVPASCNYWRVPKGYDVQGVFAFSKHGKYYYISDMAIYEDKYEMLDDIRKGDIYFNLRRKHKFY